MRKFVVTCIALFLLFLSYHTHILAKEGQTLKVFGMGATVDEVNTDEYLVKTRGEKSEEGIVYTPKEKFLTKEIMYHVTLKGKGFVLLRIEETDVRGRFIKQKDLMINLPNNWTTYELPFILEDTTSQIDAFVVTSSQAKTEFYFKDLQINNR